MSSKNSKKDSCLFLWLNSNEFHAIEASKRGVTVGQMYTQSGTFFRLIRRLFLMLHLPSISLLLNSWKKNIKFYDTVIIHASQLAPPVVKYIRKKNPDIRIIVWFWNPVDKCVPLDKFSGTNCEFWSFDEKDCKSYGLRYNSQYYFKGLKLENRKIEYDVFFVGGDKGRINELIEIQSWLNNNLVTNYFHITPTKKINEKYRDVYKERIPYSKVLEYISKSNAILDIVSENQNGLTLRPLEALFFNKKLITNDRNIIYKDFYRKENIFILGTDDIDYLPEFLNEPFIPVDLNVRNNYDFDTWISRFFVENNEFNNK
ncbi:hypothetical protein [Oceanobacillus halophilus]|uniref:Lipopolysaccharide biosynthesis protein n=1 Tax=Oceanobacillus halophilus TaxID=930130 RepID=A0A495A4S8_9BACI|nr:hypothetical protein [Oceanobacillus halophilus]RKQ34279.1 hypothetical protein D8M06_07820 [Oceanobacillus halophilus]